MKEEEAITAIMQQQALNGKTATGRTPTHPEFQSIINTHKEKRTWRSDSKTQQQSILKKEE